jgi:cobalt-zinc-cadmium efflux system outer membrane protein
VLCVPSRPFGLSFRTFAPCALASLLSLGAARPAGAAWPSLEEVWRASRQSAPRSVRAQSDAWIARAEGVGARESSLHNPTVRIDADHGVGRTPAGPSAGLAASGELGVPIELSGQRSARIRSADALVAWREREQDAAEGRAGGEAVTAYGRALVARARVDLASQAEQQAEREVAWFEARTEAGDATAVDRSLAQSELARHAQSRAEAQIDLIEAEADLRALTGLSDLTEPPDEPLAPPPQVGTRPLRAEDAARSPGIEAFARESTYWDREVDEAKATRWTPLEVMVSGGQDEFGQIRLGGGLGWSFPLVRRGEGEIARAATASARARAEGETLLRAVGAMVQGLGERMARTADAVTELDRAGIPAAERLVAATDAAFRAGKLELVRVLNARRDLALMRGRRLDLVEGGWRAYGDLASILGVLP